MLRVKSLAQPPVFLLTLSKNQPFFQRFLPNEYVTRLIRLFTSSRQIALAPNYLTYVTLTMVAAAETLPTALKSDRRPKQESIPEVYWRLWILEQKNPVALAPDVSGRQLFTLRYARLSNKTSNKGHMTVLFFITNRSIKLIY